MGWQPGRWVAAGRAAAKAHLRRASRRIQHEEPAEVNRLMVGFLGRASR
jgi:hypothetical protein